MEKDPKLFLRNIYEYAEKADRKNDLTWLLQETKTLSQTNSHNNDQKGYQKILVKLMFKKRVFFQGKVSESEG